MEKGTSKFILSLLGIGIVIGVILTLAVVGVVMLFKHDSAPEILTNAMTSSEVQVQSSDMDSSSSSESESEKESSTQSSLDDGDGEESSTVEVKLMAGDTWERERVYNSGETVQFHQRLYQSKWWTQGDVPNENDEANPWKYIGEAETSSEESSSEESNKQEPSVSKNTSVASNGLKVVGYYPDWQPDKLDRIQYDILTHINYAFAIPNEDGTLKPLEHPKTAEKIIQSAHKGKTKVLLSVGGWSYNGTPLEPTFKKATDSTQKINRFADSIISMALQYGFDGVDIDWEHPRTGDVSEKQYTELMTRLRQLCDEKKLILTISVLSGVSADGVVMYDAAAHTNQVLNCVDWVNVMAYDGGDGERHSSYKFAVDSANYWKNKRNMPPEKVVLGVPFYARPSWAAYDSLLEASPDADKSDVVQYNGMEAHYNGIETISKKTQWAKENVGGIMIWEVSQDTKDKSKSLLSAIGKAIS